MYYAKLCTNCGKPFVFSSTSNKFCCTECRREFYRKLYFKNKPKHKAKIYKQMEKEWLTTETNPTHCYKCGALIDYWTFEYASKYGRVCKKCARRNYHNQYSCNKPVDKSSK